MPETILSIRLNADGFSFSVFDPDHDRFAHFAERKLSNILSYTGNFKQAYKELDFLSHSYKQVYILQVDRRFTFIPLELFEEEQMQTLFHYNYSPKENETVCKNILVNNSCAVLFGMDKSTRSFLSEKYPQAEFFSQATLLTEYFSLRNRSAQFKQMFAYTRIDCVDLYCFDKGYVSLVNSYECKSVADFAYYILFVWKQLGMDQQTDELLIASEYSEQNKLNDILKKYIKTVLMVRDVSEFNSQVADEAKEIPLDIQVLMALKGQL